MSENNQPDKRQLDDWVSEGGRDRAEPEPLPELPDIEAVVLDELVIDPLPELLEPLPELLPDLEDPPCSTS
ncbi:MAG: hypothetical protein K8U57_29795 [Planctomycetes bacterium]|nr:hypothetical protein [Planctomycetota bacterium]